MKVWTTAFLLVDLTNQTTPYSCRALGRRLRPTNAYVKAQVKVRVLMLSRLSSEQDILLITVLGYGNSSCPSSVTASSSSFGSRGTDSFMVDISSIRSVLPPTVRARLPHCDATVSSRRSQSCRKAYLPSSMNPGSKTSHDGHRDQMRLSHLHLTMITITSVHGGNFRSRKITPWLGLPWHMVIKSPAAVLDSGYSLG